MGLCDRRSGRPAGAAELSLASESDFDGALEAMSAEELRAFVRCILEELDEEQGSALEDALIAGAARGQAGWRPSGPSQRIVDEVRRYADAARRVGYGEPDEVDGFLRQGMRAFLSGDPVTARAVFEALLPPITEVEIDLGQHEMVDEVLTIDPQECAAQYVASVYWTTPLEDRAEALCEALDSVQGFALLWTPLEQMERAAAAPLPELDRFLPMWVKHLEQGPSEDEWEEDCDRWLREAVFRLEGVAGLERIARQTKSARALRAWCEAQLKRGDWVEALRAYDEAIKLVGKSYSQGYFLDGAALAAQRLGRRDVVGRLGAAWVDEPSLVRLLRWLDGGSPAAAILVERANEAITRCSKKAGRQLGLLYVLTGDIHAAAKLLAEAPGLGWSSETHPGHVLFPMFAGLLAEGTRATLSKELFIGLQEVSRDPLEMFWGIGEKEKPRLSTPTITDVVRTAGPAASIDLVGREAMLEAMRVVATKRVEGILGNKRRRHYGHAATLVACCLELAPAVGKREVIAEWVSEQRRAYSRFSAFQKECRRALASIS